MKLPKAKITKTEYYKPGLSIFKKKKKKKILFIVLLQKKN